MFFIEGDDNIESESGLLNFGFVIESNLLKPDTL